MGTIRVRCGRLLCKHLRDILNSEKFSGRNIEWIEGNGLFSHLFTIKGDDKDIEEVSERINHWFACMGRF